MAACGGHVNVAICGVVHALLPLAASESERLCSSGTHFKVLPPYLAPSDGLCRGVTHFICVVTKVCLHLHLSTHAHAHTRTCTSHTLLEFEKF